MLRLPKLEIHHKFIKNRGGYYNWVECGCCSECLLPHVPPHCLLCYFQNEAGQSRVGIELDKNVVFRKCRNPVPQMPYTCSGRMLLEEKGNCLYKPNFH